MPRGPKGEKRPADANQRAVMVARIATGEIEDKVPDDGKNAAAVALGRNWRRKHKARGTTPAAAAGLTDKAMTMTDLVELMDAREFDALQDKRNRNSALAS
jgi:hypothetical protein